MARRPILVLPDPRLRQVAKPVEKFDEDLKDLIADMFETMYDAPGIGLAAPQIGVMERLVVVDCGLKKHDSETRDLAGDQEDGDLEEEDSEPDPIAMINPEITWVSEELSVHEEGCLSIPDYYEDVERPARCRVTYTDTGGQRITRELDGLLSTCVQHEVDHLDGKLFIDYLSRLKREMITKKFKKAARHA
ncbi:MAG TPA: peptide deformylase [Devosia sp.]|nr:peptide deformylase [Devosia sp.]